MKLSTRSRYGIRILAQIADCNAAGKLARGSEIAHKQEISEGYIEQLMIPLKKNGLVSTVRGCNGGYKLKRSPEDLTVLEIIEIFDGHLRLVLCEDKKLQCPRKNICPSSYVWEKLSSTLRAEAEKITLKDILNVSAECHNRATHG